MAKGIIPLVTGKDTSLNMNPRGQMEQEQQHPLLSGLRGQLIKAFKATLGSYIYLTFLPKKQRASG